MSATAKRRVAGKIKPRERFLWSARRSRGAVPGETKHRKIRRNGTPFHYGSPKHVRHTPPGGYHNRDFICVECRQIHRGPAAIQHCGEEMYEIPHHLTVPKSKAPNKVWKTFLAQVKIPREQEAAREERENAKRMEQRLSSYVDAVAVIRVLQDKIVNAQKHGDAESLREIDDDLMIVGLKQEHCDALIRTGHMLKARLLAQKVREALVN